ncbi:MAG: hypothetical protein CBB68_08890 [Rhodospirillaceae bacterium TMED8]|nr:hypothetical protein [Magnetovibrio sp.]OUT50477.1 MAG: hypothetical protein CBB68_08890 [Rhodospirillaceae bacterium TMED8]|tara:strand:+ start:8352 stop:8975 length:624 start_codon:yes stop_codon:yes gene_type:complete
MEAPTLKATNLIRDSAEALKIFSQHRDLMSYSDYLKDAAGVIIFPDVMKAGWFFAAEAGNGVLLARDLDGKWSDPTFHTLAAASVGLQVGVQDTSVILILRNESALQSVLKYQGKLGADIGATIVYAGVGAEAATTANLGADIIAFAAPVLGVYIGSSLEGSVLAVRRDMNEGVYGRGATPEAILSGKFQTTIAEKLKSALTNAASR